MNLMNLRSPRPQAPVLSMSVDSERQLVCAGSADGGGVILDAATGNITRLVVMRR